MLQGVQVSGNSIIYYNYSSTAQGFEASKVLTQGKHVLEFKFGNDVQYALNSATVDHTFVEVTTGQTTSSTSYVDISGATVSSSNFVTGEKYLLRYPIVTEQPQWCIKVL